MLGVNEVGTKLNKGNNVFFFFFCDLVVELRYKNGECFVRCIVRYCVMV